MKLENHYDISNWETSKVRRVPKKSDIRLKTIRNIWFNCLRDVNESLYQNTLIVRLENK